MGKTVEKEREYRDTMEIFRTEAAKNAIRAFNEGYLLGMKHAEKVLGKGESENQSK